MNSALYTTRDYLESDKNFIFASWLRGLYYGNSLFREMNKDVFMSNYHKVIEQILALDSTKIKVACLEEDPEVILGYAVLGGPTRLHWVFVKSHWRGILIAESLIPPTVDTVTHITKSGLSLLRKHPNVQFNPFALS